MRRACLRHDENLDQRALDNFVFRRRVAERPLPAVGFGDVGAARRLCPVRSPVHAVMQIGQPIRQTFAVVRPCHPVHAGCRIPLEPMVGLLQQGDVDVVQQGGELLPFPVLCCLAYARDPR
jgi:hypothetical protein